MIQISIVTEILKRFWKGDIELKKSFWLWCFLGGGVLSLIGEFIPDPETPEELAYGFFYLFCHFLILFFLWIGTWRSAENYKKKRKKYLWALAAQFWIVLSISFLVYGVYKLI